MESTSYTIDGKVYTVRRGSSQLQHHGVKGMKWGVRRYQNKDGTLTPAGKKRYGDNPDGAETPAKTHKTAKRVAAALVMTATAAAAVAAYKKNPEAVRSVLSKVGNSTIEGAKKAGRKTYEAGKKYVKEACDSAKQGVKDGIKNAPRKAAETVVTGVTMMAVKRILDASVGKEEAARIFQANNKKKIGSFWKVSQDDKDDD